MLPHLRRRRGAPGRTARAGLLLAPLAAVLLIYSACDKVPLLAPTGSTISLYASSSVLAPSGSIDLIATVIEAGSSGGGTGSTATASTGGQPVHNGTLVTFTTTIGSITPNEARTNNGQVTVKLTGDGRSGVASIFAYSGGAKSSELKINVGSAAVDHVILTADPQTLPPAGGTAQLSARVEDASGYGLTGVDVTFSTTTGTIANTTVKTNDSAIATTQLTTSQAAKVTATCGAKNASVDISLSPRTGVSITPPSSPPSAGTPAVFTVAVSSTANVRDVTVNWGDGLTTSLGAVSGSTSASHVYSRSGTYTVTATATDANGNKETVSTTVTVLAASPVTVTVTASPTSPTTNQTVTFTASATAPTGSSISRYDWNFGDGSSTGTASTSGGSASHVYAAAGQWIVTVTATATNGATGTGQTIVSVTQPALVTITVTASSTTPVVGQSVSFTATNSTLPSGVSITGYTWNYGDGSPAFSGGPVVSHTFTSAAVRDITVSVALSSGGPAIGQTTITVTNAPPVNVTVSAVPTSFPAATGGTVLFTATPSTLPPGTVVDHYEWNFGDGSPVVSTTGNTTTHAYIGPIAAGAKTVTVTVVLSNAVTGTGYVIVTAT